MLVGSIRSKVKGVLEAAVGGGRVTFMDDGKKSEEASGMSGKEGMKKRAVPDGRGGRERRERM